MKKTTKTLNLSQKQFALVAGLSLFTMTIAAIFSEFSVLQNIFISSDIQATYSNVSTNLHQIPFAIFGYLIVFITDISAAWALYILLKSTNQNLSLLTAWLRIFYTIIAACSLFYLTQIPRLLNTPNIQSIFSETQLQTQIFFLLHNFYDAWGIGYIFFGIHLSLLGYLIIKSKFIPKLIGLLVSIAGLTYIIDYLGKYLLPNTILKTSTMFGWGELIFMVWLLYKGISRKGLKTK